MKIEKINLNNESIYLAKSKFFGWGVVYPNKNDDGSINWFNLLTGGSLLRLFIVIIIVLLVIGLAYEYMGNLSQCQIAFDYYNLQNINQMNLSLWG